MKILFEILTITGALGLFIFGMKVMSDGIQRAAGASMRSILEAMTRSQWRAVSSGFLTTAALQTSSAVTVMVVSFVNAGLLRLREAIGVIMGANIGTTVTAWLIALALGNVSISDYTLIIITFALPFLFFKRERWKSTAEAVIGFAILFIGLKFLQDAVPNLKANLDLIEFLKSYTDQGFLTIIFFMLAGVVITLIVQSSSAAIALTLTLLTSDIITTEMAAAMVLGENIGTTVTANIAAVVANPTAKKAARAHTVINVIGVIWMIPLLGVFLDGLQSAFGGMFEAMTFVSGDNQEKVLIALFHTTFNLLNMLILVGFTPFIIKVSSRLVRERKSERFKLEYIGAGVVGTPELAFLEVQKEMQRFARMMSRMNPALEQLLGTNEPAQRDTIIQQIREGEEMSDRFRLELSNFMTDLARKELSDNTSQSLRGLMGASNDLERIGDLYFQIAMNLENKAMQKVYFVPKQRQNLIAMTQLLEDAFRIMQRNLDLINAGMHIKEAREKEEEINTLRNQLRRKHLKDVSKGRYSLESGMFYMDTFTTLEEIADHVMSISEGLVNQA